MKVIVNGRFLLHRTTGVERYARELLQELDNLIQPGEIVMAIPTETKDVPEYKNIKVKKVGKLGNRLWEHISLSLIHISEPTRRTPISYAVFCLKKKKITKKQ